MTTKIITPTFSHDTTTTVMTVQQLKLKKLIQRRLVVVTSTSIPEPSRRDHFSTLLLTSGTEECPHTNTLATFKVDILKLMPYLCDQIDYTKLFILSGPPLFLRSSLKPTNLDSISMESC